MGHLGPSAMGGYQASKPMFRLITAGFSTSEPSSYYVVELGPSTQRSDHVVGPTGPVASSSPGAAPDSRNIGSPGTCTGRPARSQSHRSCCSHVNLLHLTLSSSTQHHRMHHWTKLNYRSVECALSANNLFARKPLAKLAESLTPVQVVDVYAWQHPLCQTFRRVWLFAGTISTTMS
jgi:hypothetical protein